MPVVEDWEFDTLSKTITYTGSGSCSVNELYCLSMDLFATSPMMEHPIPFVAYSMQEISMLNGWVLGEQSARAINLGSIFSLDHPERTIEGQVTPVAPKQPGDTQWARLLKGGL